MLKVILSLTVVFVLTNGLPLKFRDSDLLEDYARKIIPRERSDLEDAYDGYLSRREPNEGEKLRWGISFNSLCRPHILYVLTCGYLLCFYRSAREGQTRL